MKRRKSKELDKFFALVEAEIRKHGYDWEKYGLSKTNPSADPSKCSRCGRRLLPGEICHNTQEHKAGIHDSFYCSRCYSKTKGIDKEEVRL